MNLLAETSWYTGTAVIERAVPLLLLPFLTRLLTPDEYGFITLFAVVATLYGTLVGIGQDGFVRVIYFRVDESEFRSHVANVFSVFVISFVLVAALSWFFAEPLFETLGLTSGWLMLAIVVAAARFLIAVRLNLYQASHAVWRYSALQLFSAGADLLLVAVLVFYLSGGGEARVQSLIAAALLAGLFASIDLAREKLLKLEWNAERIKRSLSFSLPILPHTFAMIAVFTFDKMIITGHRGLEMTGMIAVALSLASPSMVLAESVNKAFLPWCYEKFRDERLADVVTVSYMLLAGMALFCVLYSVLLWAVFDWLVGEKFRSSLAASLVLVWAGWGKLMYLLTMKGLGFKEITQQLPVISGLSAAIYLLALYFVIDGADLVLVAQLIVGYHMLMAIVTLIYGQLRFPQPWFDFGAMYAFLRERFPNHMS